MLEEEYQLDYFKSQGFVRKICTKCGAAYWTRDPERETCGDAPCEPYSFIGNPVFEPHTLDEMREAFLSFFERHGHTRIERYPVVARWRDDIYLTIASIADFQPYVTSGLVPPPANPLTISQPCIRLNDLDSVGRSGRHLTLFEMMAHHAFNSPVEDIYWKDRTVEFCDQFLASIGADLEKVTYKEHPWIGGGNAGASVEVLIAGLEVATLVFMCFTREPNDQEPIDLEGEPYYPMKMRIVDTGYGLERITWASRGSPTVYDAVFPTMVSHLMQSAGLEHLLDNKEFTKILGLNAKFAGLMDISGANLYQLRRKVADAIDVPLDKLDRMITPIEKIYAIADHTRCLAYMLGDCIVPSNVKEGYLARLVIRRTLRMMSDLDLKDTLADLVEMQIRTIGTDSFEQSVSVVRDIIERETEKYAATLARGARTVQRLAKSYKKKSERIPLQEVVTLYDSHGIPPEMVREIAAQEGAVVDIPDDFYSQIADIHSENRPEKAEDPLAKFHDRAGGLPETRALYYEQPASFEFEAMVIDVFEGYVVLDQTLFYPEGGGQPSDTGTLVTAETVARVESVVKLGNVILHKVQGAPLKRGERVKGILDEERRWSLMRHHTATHILLHAAQEVLGAHIHQAGAQKGSETSRLDLRHFKHITPEELTRIELRANEIVMENLPVYISQENRTRAEQKYGFGLYQGGVPPGKVIRVVQMAGDVQACAGTHCRSTGEVGPIAILRVEHIQDGFERLEFSAGIAAIYAMQHLKDLIDASAETLSVQQENLPSSVTRFFTEWKEQRKEIERLQEKVVELEVNQLKGEEIGGLEAVIKEVDLPPKELVALASRVAESGKIAVLAGGTDRVHAVVASPTDDLNATEIIREVCAALGGKGGGKPTLAQGSGQDASMINEALARGRALIAAKLNV
ncbi:alanine--tRNA ligase [Methanofollis aquaemaris]|uniref:Alanine--tRNA ligase n=1 Tax=Methanofollis aquaemaris TaxID=126734 RepID=A0A8A3S2N0_9EURY|nr:alanine--tRNA ligase [Methanofollis aquaemaris]QSZ66041.1 alanine--tRNA ligase [Methanofollis aquaemaris]